MFRILSRISRRMRMDSEALDDMVKVDSELVGPEGAADFLGVSRYKLNRYRIEGWIPMSGIRKFGTGFVYQIGALQACKDAKELEAQRARKNVRVVNG